MSSTFERVGQFHSGYDCKEVDSFLREAKAAYAKFSYEDAVRDPKAAGIDEDSVRNASFSWTRNGYSPEQVDAALDRLEAAFIQRRRAGVMSSAGEQAWLEQTYDSATTLYPRMLRPEGERFSDAHGRGYAKGEVDEFLNQIAEYFDGKANLTSKEVRRTHFNSARDADAYDESVVDVYLDRVVSVLMAVE
ncbi:DivIVA domain-containing protein [Arcanobacterium bovis]|uniref:DivIVA domain-containing protein n=1 Tax=Arcanobacterium bovis TaxID=2529275 RepID=A0A4Q9V2D6_9ACTO|nr:DivIVA domain-containing protein [Arcanobacterium bovis]TBW22718.1 DivIVA domain-containing protein [Arcanobacterium bovis]